MRKTTRPKPNDLEVELALWYRALWDESNPAFFPLFFDEHRYMILKGGGGSGKSIFAGRKVIERCMDEPGHRFLVCRKVARTLRDSCFQQLIGQCSALGITVKPNYSDMVIKFANGSMILFAGLDDVEKLKSIYNVTGIWIEEASELLESDFNQLDIRLRGQTEHYKQIIVTFNPISINHWLKRRFFDQKDDRVITSETTYKDNRFLDPENIRVLEAYKDTDEYYYTVYCLGQWGTTGKTVFNAADVQRRLNDNIQPVKVGWFEYEDTGTELKNIRWVDDPQGFIRIYADKKDGVPYVIGGDTAGEGSDSFVAQVLDNRSGVQVAVMRHTTDEDLYAKQLYCLGMHYNTALVGVETNFSTYPVMELERLRYPKQYVRETVDDYTHSIKRSFGFRTDSRTRPIIISQLITACRDDINIVCDRTTLEEMLTFVRTEKWQHPEAEEGAHDDCVMALAIAHHIRPQQKYLATEPEEPAVKWNDSQWEDYRAATPEQKKMLIEKWGRPKR